MDGGEDVATKKRSPVLAGGGSVATKELLGRFHEASTGLEAPLRRFVTEKLEVLALRR